MYIASSLHLLALVGACNYSQIGTPFSLLRERGHMRIMQCSPMKQRFVLAESLDLGTSAGMKTNFDLF